MRRKPGDRCPAGIHIRDGLHAAWRPSKGGTESSDAMGCRSVFVFRAQGEPLPVYDKEQAPRHSYNRFGRGATLGTVATARPSTTTEHRRDWHHLPLKITGRSELLCS